MNIYTLFWLDGKTETVKGYDPAHAMTLRGYGNGTLRALDFYGKGDLRHEYIWNKEEKKWKRI